MIIDRRDPKETGREYALRVIKNNIIRLELAPGSTISENELAADLGLSRTPVREAIIELSRIKIINTHPQKKSVVAEIDYDMVEEAHFMRRVLEREVVAEVCDCATDEDIAELHDNLKLQHFYYDNKYAELMTLDDEFHKLVFAIAKKSQIYEMMKNYSIHFDRVRHMSLASVKNTKIIMDHDAIVDAIEKHDRALAQELTEKHLNRYKIDADVIKANYPQYFGNK